MSIRKTDRRQLNFHQDGLIDEPIDYNTQDSPTHIVCEGSDDDYYNDPDERVRRSEIAGQRYLEGQIPVIFSASLRGPFSKESGWRNPWRSKHRLEPDLKSQKGCNSGGSNLSIDSESVSTDSVVSLNHAEYSLAPEQESGGNDLCHLPSPESLSQVPLCPNKFLDGQEAARVQTWRRSVRSISLEKDDFWVPRVATMNSSAKKRRAENCGWLRTLASKRRRTSDWWDDDELSTSQSLSPSSPASRFAKAPSINESTADEDELSFTFGQPFISSPRHVMSASQTTKMSPKMMGPRQNSGLVGELSDDELSKTSHSTSNPDSQSSSRRKSSKLKLQQSTARKSSKLLKPKPIQALKRTARRNIELEQSVDVSKDHLDDDFESQEDHSFHYRIRPHRHNNMSTETTYLASPSSVFDETLVNDTVTACSSNDKADMKVPNGNTGEQDLSKSGDIILRAPMDNQPLETLSSISDVVCQSDLASAMPLNNLTQILDVSPNELRPVERPEIPMIPAKGDDLSLNNAPMTEDTVHIDESQTAGNFNSALNDQAASTEDVSVWQTKLDNTLPNNHEDEPILSQDGLRVPMQNDTPSINENTDSVAPRTKSGNPSEENPSTSFSLTQTIQKLYPQSPWSRLSQLAGEALASGSLRVFGGGSPIPNAKESIQKVTSNNSNPTCDPAISTPSIDIVSELLASTPKVGEDDIVHTHTTDNVRLETQLQSPWSNDQFTTEGLFTPQESKVIRVSDHEIELCAVPGSDAGPVAKQSPWMASTQSASFEPGTSRATLMETPRPKTPEPVFSIKAFANFMSPSPDRPRAQYKGIRSSGSRLSSTKKPIAAMADNPWTNSSPSSRRVSWVPLPQDEAMSVDEQPATLLSKERSGWCDRASPPPTTPIADLPTGKDDKFGTHFKVVATRASGLRQQLLPTSSQQFLNSPAIGAMAEAFVTADDMKQGVDSNPTDQTDSQGVVFDDVDAVMHNLDEFLSTWDVETDLVKARAEE
jgi:hypothetical protein